ncbi:hypothetical protein [Nocardia tenerifensis]|uniref:hypothetical protein n=1 Tax=Nocardia tenerifensis TaxID=228006 RepID=UPI000592CDA8|nr:hypothetical protein [Nocardia tenerifensis]
MTQLIQGLADDADVLNKYGLTMEEYRLALPGAIEQLRGRQSASVSERKEFLYELLQTLVENGYLARLEKPDYGKDTVYRLTLSGFGDVAIIQKGCPDGAHSSKRWKVPEWARETYLWWLCDSTRYEPGAHVDKGVKRLLGEFLGARPDTLSGVIFHDRLCGSPNRPCPKSRYALQVGERSVPPPCVYVMPDRDSAADAWNWNGEVRRVFPEALLQAFGITPSQASQFIGHIGFQRRQGAIRTTITSRFGPGRATTFRS